MTAVFCHNASDRKADTWQEQLAPFKNLQFAIPDGAKGIAAAVQQTAQLRRERDPSASALEQTATVHHASTFW